MSPVLITVLMFGSVILFMVTGVPIAFILGGVGIGFGIWLWGPAATEIIYYSTMDLMYNFIFAAIPLFVFMGLVLQESGVAEDLFDTIHRWAGGIKGGLGMGTVAICAVMAAMVGITGAATVTMGVIALPAMLKRKYDKRIAVGLIMAGGALGFLIPPSVMMIMYAFLSGVSVGKLFAGGMLPGLMLATMYITYIGVRCYFQPEMGPPLPPEDRTTWREKIIALRGIVLPVILVVMVLGFIFLGVTSPTEAAGVGALGALISAAVHRKLNWGLVKKAGLTTLRLSGMIFWITIAAIALGKIYTGLGAPEMIRETMSGLGIGPWGILIMIQLSFFIMGMFLDDIAILFIAMPIYIPIVVGLGFDPLWFAILYIVNMQMAYLTPPYGFNLFYMRGVAPPEITMGDIYRSVIPFVGLQALGLAMIMIFPQIVLWLPNLIFGIK